ncbi:unnamed protein product [Polarella glacialis]|uniref:Uncharacterized protein n=1 Tax=Polarella glacialis TaxID=89957 RepID=A0A813F9G3_POLGL|nr:unnamed protein product [Polarella glacialis]
MFSSTCRFEEADETYLPFAQSPEAEAERRRIISSLNIEPSVFCNAFSAPPVFTLSRPSPEVKVANTFIHVESQDPDEFVAHRSASSPPKVFKLISSPKQQQSEAVRPEANQGGVASAEHAGFESPGRSSTQQQQQQQQQQEQQQQNQQQKMQAHQRSQCRPCSFQSAKADSCRLGDDCQLCPSYAQKAKRANNNNNNNNTDHNHSKQPEHNSKTRSDSQQTVIWNTLRFCHLCTYEDFMHKKNAGKHDRRKRLRGEKRQLLAARCSEQQGGESSSPEALQTWATEKPRSLPFAPPGARFLTTWPSAWMSTFAEEVQPQIIAEKVHPKRYLEPRAGSSGYQRTTKGANASRAHGSPQREAAIAAWFAARREGAEAEGGSRGKETRKFQGAEAEGGSSPYFPATTDY